MLQIDNLSVQVLKEKLYVAYMMFTKAAIENDEYIQETFRFYVDRFMASYNHLDNVYLKYDVDNCTKAVQSADDDRDMKFRKMRDMIKMFITYPETEEKTQAAEELMRVIDLYGGTEIPHQGITAETASVSNLVDDFEKRYMPQVELLGIGDALAALKSAQAAFDEVYMARDLCESQIGKNAMADARARMDEDYRLLVSVINNKKYEDTEGKLDAFIKLMNVEIGRNRTYTGQGQVGSTTKPKPDEGEDEEDDGNVTLTFEKADETTITLTGMPGEAYEIPELAEGKIWVSAEDGLLVPNGVFPDEDATFIEVALGERKSVVFHFLNGEHETFTGLPGTEYEVPDTDEEDCVWSPEPTGVIPDVDTQYFETRVPAQEEDERPKYKITFRAGGSLIAIKEYHEGETIVPPDCPEGFRWPDDMPTVMPAQNVTVRAEGLDD